MSAEKFKHVPMMNCELLTIRQDTDPQFVRGWVDGGEFVLCVTEARALRDWLNKALPEPPRE